jgi:hypothetical protein
LRNKFTVPSPPRHVCHENASFCPLESWVCILLPTLRVAPSISLQSTYLLRRRQALVYRRLVSALPCADSFGQSGVYRSAEGYSRKVFETCFGDWRRKRDSNPRYPFGYTRLKRAAPLFRCRPFQPRAFNHSCHSSAVGTFCQPEPVALHGTKVH